MFAFFFLILGLSADNLKFNANNLKHSNCNKKYRFLYIEDGYLRINKKYFRLGIFVLFSSVIMGIFWFNKPSIEQILEKCCLERLENVAKIYKSISQTGELPKINENLIPLNGSLFRPLVFYKGDWIALFYDDRYNSSSFKKKIRIKWHFKAASVSKHKGIEEIALRFIYKDYFYGKKSEILGNLKSAENVATWEDLFTALKQKQKASNSDSYIIDERDLVDIIILAIFEKKYEDFDLEKLIKDNNFLRSMYISEIAYYVYNAYEYFISDINKSIYAMNPLRVAFLQEKMSMAKKSIIEINKRILEYMKQFCEHFKSNEFTYFLFFQESLKYGLNSECCNFASNLDEDFGSEYDQFYFPKELTNIKYTFIFMHMFNIFHIKQYDDFALKFNQENYEKGLITTDKMLALVIIRKVFPLQTSHQRILLPDNNLDKLLKDNNLLERVINAIIHNVDTLKMQINHNYYPWVVNAFDTIKQDIDNIINGC